MTVSESMSLDRLALSPTGRDRLLRAGVVDVDAAAAVLEHIDATTLARWGLPADDVAAITRARTGPVPKVSAFHRGLTREASRGVGAKAPPWEPGSDLNDVRVPRSASLAAAVARHAVRNQEQRGTCVAFAASAAVALNRGEASPLSPEYLYWQMKRASGFPGEEGSWARVALEVLEDEGVCLESLHPYDGRPRGPGLPDQGREPDSRAVADARNRRSGESILASRIDDAEVPDDPEEDWFDWLFSAGAIAAKSSSEPLLHLARAAVAGSLGVPPRAVIGCFAVYDSSFAAGGASGVMSLPLPGESQSGGHAMTIVGYRDDSEAPGGGYLEVLNSWGDDWPMRSRVGPGIVLIPYSYAVKHLWETGVPLLPGERQRLNISTPGRFRPEMELEEVERSRADVPPPPVQDAVSGRVQSLQDRHAARMAALQERLSPPTGSTRCDYCGSTAYGQCSRGPGGYHRHNADGGHCCYCGSTGYGGCSYSPHRFHEHGPGRGCRFCGSSARGQCSRGPDGVHVH